MIKYKFSETQEMELRKFWKGVGGVQRLTDNFVKEMLYYVNEYQHAKVVVKNGRSLETEEREKYIAVEKACDKLMLALKDVPELDRINILSMREKQNEFGNKVVPICDPYEYVGAIKELAAHYSYELKKLKKYEKQFKGLKSYIVRFPECRNIPDSRAENLFYIINPEMPVESFKKNSL